MQSPRSGCSGSWNTSPNCWGCTDDVLIANVARHPVGDAVHFSQLARKVAFAARDRDQIFEGAFGEGCLAVLFFAEHVGRMNHRVLYGEQTDGTNQHIICGVALTRFSKLTTLELLLPVTTKTFLSWWAFSSRWPMEGFYEEWARFHTAVALTSIFLGGDSHFQRGPQWLR